MTKVPEAADAALDVLLTDAAAKDYVEGAAADHHQDSEGVSALRPRWQVSTRREASDD